MKRVLGVLFLSLGIAALWAQEASEVAAEAAPGAGDAAPAATEAASEAPVGPAKATTPKPGEIEPAVEPVADAARSVIYVLPVRGQISRPTLFVIRRGLKDAITAGAQFVVLDMDTPGGGLGETLEIMESLDKYEGRVATYVNREAGSAGAIIAAVTDDIYFAPKSVIGAAEVVLATGEDVGAGMKRKITSFLSAKVRTYISGEDPVRGMVLQAMMDPNFEFTIDGEVIKQKGDLLTLTEIEAMKEYGDPPRPLLGAGIHENLPALYRHLAGGSGYEVRTFEITWSVKLAQWLTMLSPIFLSLGGLLLFLEFKTPGFGAAGVAGIALILLVLFGHNVAGLSGHEAMLVFVLGFALVMIELLFMPGTIFLAVTGMLLMLGSLLWGMADIWPGTAFELSPDLFLRPIANLLAGAGMAVIMALALARFLPHSWIWDHLLLKGAVTGVSGSPVGEHGAAVALETESGLIGAIGVAASGLYPSGVVEVDGRRVQARLEVGSAAPGVKVRIVRRADFVYIVEVIS